jgi:BirA family biotin operon repressor/biotin-[acetyl-CoA-carboxylase] ligase
MPEPLPSEFASALRATADRRGHFGEPIYFFTDTESTNDAAAALAERGAPEGTTVLALAQRQGRGRLGRTWFSPAGAGLYVSIVCRDRRAAPMLTLAGGVAVADGIRSATGLPVELKWPNDVVTVGGRARKLAGILAEASTGGDGLQHVVLGIGINVLPAAYPPEISARAASIEGELGRSVEAGLVLAETLAALAGHVGRLAAGDREALLQRWRELAPSATGKPVEWDTPSGCARGTTAGIDSDGALLVRTGPHVERIVAGELRWG